MIFDQLKNSHLYFPLGEKFEKAFNYLSNTDFTNLEPGKYEIDGEDIFAIVQLYNTKPSSAGKWEAHRKYADIQYIFSGKEKMGVTSLDKVIVLEQYKPYDDYGIYKGEGNFIIIDEGSFTVFFPTDVHMPSLALNIPKEVKKVVIKVRVAEAEIEPEASTEATTISPTE